MNEQSKVYDYIVKVLPLCLLIPIIWGCNSAAGKTTPPPVAVTVSVTTASRSDVPVSLSGLGTVTPLNTVTVRTRVDGELMRVAVREGQQVKKGELLAQIDARPYQVQLEQAEGQLLRDQALLKNAQLDLERYQTLLTQDAGTQQQRDTQIATVAGYEGNIKVDQSNINSARLQITYCNITSPIDGRVGLRLVDPGNIVHATDTNGLFIITEVEPITVVFTLSENQLPPVLKKVNSGETLHVDAMDRNGIQVLASGTLLTIDNQIDTTTGTFKLKAVFDNKDGALFPNQFVNARLKLEILKQEIIVPASAIQHGPQGNFVYVIDAQKKAHVRSVKTGDLSGNNVVIASGVTEGEKIVSDGADNLREGSLVEVR